MNMPVNAGEVELLAFYGDSRDSLKAAFSQARTEFRRWRDDNPETPIVTQDISVTSLDGRREIVIVVWVQEAAEKESPFLNRQTREREQTPRPYPLRREGDGE